MAGLAQPQNDGSVGVGGAHVGIGAHISLFDSGAGGTARIGLVGGGSAIVGGWDGDVLVVVSADGGLALRIGRGTAFIAQATWSPAMIAAEGDFTGSGAGYRILAGLRVDDLGMGLGWRGLQRADEYALHLLEAWVTLGY
jgi:hypothetical protein